MGNTRTMFANIVSNCLDLTGPSYRSDNGCSSGLQALQNAYRDISNGMITAAIVGGGNICLNPLTTMMFSKLGMFKLI